MPKENSAIKTDPIKSNQPNDGVNSGYSKGMDTSSNIIFMPDTIDFEIVKSGREIFSLVKVVDLPVDNEVDVEQRLTPTHKRKPEIVEKPKRPYRKRQPLKDPTKSPDAEVNRRDAKLYARANKEFVQTVATYCKKSSLTKNEIFKQALSDYMKKKPISGVPSLD